MNRLVIWLLAATLLAPRITRAQEHPAKRLSSIVGVAVEEYAKGVDEHGQLIAPGEYQEASDFLVDAKNAAGRLSGDRAAEARAILDTLASAMAAKRPPSELALISKRLSDALGSEGAMDLPTRAMDIAEGHVLFEHNC